VEFGSRLLLTLRLQKDYGQTEEILVQLRNHLLLASLYVSIALGITLWLIFRFMAIKPLEKEITRRRQAEGQLAETNRSLEERVKARTKEISQLLAREIYLREIMQTVADINGLLITAPDLNNLLSKACSRLARHGHYEFCWLGLLENGTIRTVYHSLPRQTPTKSGQEAAPADEKAPTIARLTPPHHNLDDPHTPFYQHPATRCLQEDRTVLASRRQYPHANALWREQPYLTGFQHMVALPLRPGSNTPQLGMLAVYSWRPQGFETEEIAMLEELAGDLGFAIAAHRQRAEIKGLTAERTANYEETILTFVNMIELRDTYTAGHTQRVSEYCQLIARQMELPFIEVKNLAKAAILHDIGKIATPDAILMKPGRFTSLEYDLIRLHTVTGYEMLAGIDMYQELADIVLHHHEQHDGKGYPDGLSGEQIPLPARILAVADAFDAMTTNRIYQHKIDVPTALAKLQAMSGRQFHPEVVAAAVKALALVKPPDSPARQIETERFCQDHDALCRFTQTPLSDLEKERFAYFFSDQLTGLYNENYLKNILKEKNHNSLTICHLQGLTDINHQQGWKAGNTILHRFAEELRRQYPEALLFRVYGIDFAIMTADYQQIIQEEIARFTSLAGSGITPVLHHIDLNQHREATIDKLERVELIVP
jgi:putative nucleotidyltransferase with HDIG domain